MKGSEFVNLLRKVIREEVRTIVKEELKAIKPLLAEAQLKPAKSNNQPVKQAPMHKKPIISIDGALGDILRETAENMYSAPQQQEEWPDMNGGPITSDFAMGDGDGFAPQAHQPMNMGMMSGDPTAMFMKDYSGVLKQAENIAQQSYRGS